MSLKASRRRFPISHSSRPEREREKKKYIQSRSLTGLSLNHRFHNAEIWKGLRCLEEKRTDLPAPEIRN